MMLVALTGIFASCQYDDDDLWDSVNSLAERVSALETLTKQMNSDISAMQNIVAAWENQVTVSNVETLTDGYIIHFSNGTKAVIKNGTNGKDGKDGKDGVNAPVIDVAQDKGVYYWTITVDGKTSWLTDDAGNKLPVSGTNGKDGTNGTNGTDGEDGSNGEDGEDGTDGVTPMLKVDTDGYWMVSYDNGTTYTYVLDADGEKVSAVGAKGDTGLTGAAGDSKFDATSPVKDNGDGTVTIKLADGTEYTFVKLASVQFMDGETVLTSTEDITLHSAVPLVLNYSFPSNLENASVEVLKTNGVEVVLDEETQQITIKNIGNDEGEVKKAVLLFYNANQTITSVLTFQTITTEEDLRYVAANGGNIALTSDLTLNEALVFTAKGNDIYTNINLNSYTLTVNGTETRALVDGDNRYDIAANMIVEKEVNVTFGEGKIIASATGILNDKGVLELYGVKITAQNNAVYVANNEDWEHWYADMTFEPMVRVNIVESTLNATTGDGVKTIGFTGAFINNVNIEAGHNALSLESCLAEVNGGTYKGGLYGCHVYATRMNYHECVIEGTKKDFYIQAIDEAHKTDEGENCQHTIYTNKLNEREISINDVIGESIITGILVSAQELDLLRVTEVGGSFTLTSDLTLNYPLVFHNNVDINLGGHTLTVNGYITYTLYEPTNLNVDANVVIRDDVRATIRNGQIVGNKTAVLAHKASQLWMFTTTVTAEGNAVYICTGDWDNWYGLENAPSPTNTVMLESCTLNAGYIGVKSLGYAGVRLKMLTVNAGFDALSLESCIASIEGKGTYNGELYGLHVYGTKITYSDKSTIKGNTADIYIQTKSEVPGSTDVCSNKLNEIEYTSTTEPGKGEEQIDTGILKNLD